MSEELLGDDFRIFWDQDNDFDTPDWVEEISIGDMSFDPGNKQVEIPKRIPFVTYKKGRADWSLKFNLNYDKTNDMHMAIRDAITNGTKIHLAICDGDNITENDYWHANWFVTGPLDGALDKPAGYAVEGKIHFDTGTDGSETPAFVNGSS